MSPNQCCQISFTAAGNVAFFLIVNSVMLSTTCSKLLGLLALKYKPSSAASLAIFSLDCRTTID